MKVRLLAVIVSSGALAAGFGLAGCMEDTARCESDAEDAADGLIGDSDPGAWRAYATVSWMGCMEEKEWICDYEDLDVCLKPTDDGLEMEYVPF